MQSNKETFIDESNNSNSNMNNENSANNHNNSSEYLSTMIDCINDRNNSSHAKQQQLNLTNLYGRAGDMIIGFDSSINRCKKYNEAKINRKYEIIIRDLRSEIQKLSNKLKLQQEARSPTKKHISDILDKLVTYRDENQKLKKYNQQANIKIQSLSNQVSIQQLALQKLQIEQPKTSIQRLPSINNNGNFLDTLKQFMKDKQEVRKLTSTPISNFEKFLRNYKIKMWNWNFVTFLQKVDKWSQGIKDKPEIDMWKIRSSVARKFSSYLDQPNDLVKASILTKRHKDNLSQSNSVRLNKIFHGRNNSHKFDSSFT